jgi:hypothetical protein
MGMLGIFPNTHPDRAPKIYKGSFPHHSLVTTDMASLIELLLLLVTLWTARWLWVLLSARRILHNIPGPPSPSFLTGKSHRLSSLIWLMDVTGNFLEIYALNAWDFHHSLAEKCALIFYFASHHIRSVPHPYPRWRRLPI